MFMSEIFLLFLGMQCFYVNDFALLNFWFRYIHWLVGFWEVQNKQRRASCSGTPLNNPAVKFSLSLLEVDGVKFCNYYFLPEITPLLWWWNPVLMMTGRCYTIYTNLLLLVLQLAVVGMICLISFSCIENIPGLYMIRVWKRKNDFKIPAFLLIEHGNFKIGFSAPYSIIYNPRKYLPWSPI